MANDKVNFTLPFVAPAAAYFLSTSLQQEVLGKGDMVFNEKEKSDGGHAGRLYRYDALPGRE